MKTHTFIKHLSYLFTATLFFLSPMAIAQSQAAIAIPQVEHLPPLAELEQAMLNQAGMNPKQVESWQKRSRWAAALPRLQVGWESNFLNQNTTVIQDNLSVTSSGITVGPESNRLDVDVENNQDLEVKAVWAFDELIFNRDELSVSREARDLYFVRTRLIEELHQSYYDLKSLLLASRTDSALSQEIMWQLKVERQLEKINSLTGRFLERRLNR